MFYHNLVSSSRTKKKFLFKLESYDKSVFSLRYQISNFSDIKRVCYPQFVISCLNREMVFAMKISKYERVQQTDTDGKLLIILKIRKLKETD